MPAVCDDGDEAVSLVEEVDVPDAKRADHVEGTSRPRGETQPMPVTTTLRKGGARVWADMIGRWSASWASQHVWWRFAGAWMGSGAARRRHGRLAIQ